MYLEDRTVSLVHFDPFIISVDLVLKLLEMLKASICFQCRRYHLFPFHHFTLCFDFIFLIMHFVRYVIMFLVPNIISRFCFPFIPWLVHDMSPYSYIHFTAGHRFGCSSGIQPDRNVSAASSPVTSATQLLLWWFMT